jgi:hypothetical protein
VLIGCRFVSLVEGDIVSVIAFRSRLGLPVDTFSQEVDVAALYPRAEKRMGHASCVGESSIM